MATSRRPSANPNSFTAAVEWFRRKLPMLTDSRLREMEDEARRRAFWVSGLTQLSMVQQVWEAIDRAGERGDSFEDFRKAVGQQVEEAWGGTVANPAARLENIFRTNLGSNYNAGRWWQLNDPVTMRLFPYWGLSVTHDDRTSPYCAPLANVILPAGDPWWEDNWPLRHFQCRDTVRGYTKAEAERRGITRSRPNVPPQEGFGRAPSRGEWKPDISKVPGPLRRLFRSKTGKKA